MIVIRATTADKINLCGVIEVICTACGHHSDMQQGVLIIPEELCLPSFYEQPEGEDQFVAQLMEAMSKPLPGYEYQEPRPPNSEGQ